MLNSIKAMHERGFVHRDVKPSNFVRRDPKGTAYCVIDFGLSKQVMNNICLYLKLPLNLNKHFLIILKYREKDGSIRARRENSAFRGTTVYASLSAHEGIDQSPRDDCFGIMNVFFDMVAGKLPWSEQARAKDKAEVVALKRKFYRDQPLEEFMKWLSNTAKEAEDSARSENEVASKSTSSENFPPIAQDNCVKILEYLQVFNCSSSHLHTNIHMYMTYIQTCMHACIHMHTFSFVISVLVPVLL